MTSITSSNTCLGKITTKSGQLDECVRAKKQKHSNTALSVCQDKIVIGENSQLQLGAVQLSVKRKLSNW